MNKLALSFFKKLMETSTPSGTEYAGQKVVAEYMTKYADRVDADVQGNVCGIINGNAKMRVMLAGHCDEIGLIVQHIDENGYVYVQKIGGVNVRLLQAERIVIRGRKGPVSGVFGIKALHCMSEKEKDTPVRQIHELWVDIGAKSRKDAEKYISVGDVATIDSGWIDLQNGLIACRGIDDRVGAFIVSDVLRLLKGRKLNVAVHAVSTVQEEIGLKGARTSAYGIDPHIGIVAEVGFATDHPETNEKKLGTAHLGSGPILACGPVYNQKVLDMFRKAGKTGGVKVQHQSDAGCGGTDALAIQVTRTGVPVGLVSVPCRYMHSPVETISLKDVESTVKLIAEFITNLTGKEKLKPWG